MPGWWFTVESTTIKHLQHQFMSAIDDALASKTPERALMRARSAKQRFPVAQWIKDLDILQSTAIAIHQEEAGSGSRSVSRSGSRPPSPPMIQRPVSEPDMSGGLGRTLSLGVRTGPGRGRRTIAASRSNPALSGVYEEQEADYMDELQPHTEVLISREQADDMAAHQHHLRGPFTPEMDPNERSRGRSRALHQLTVGSPNFNVIAPSPIDSRMRDGLAALSEQHDRLLTGSAGNGDLRHLRSSSGSTLSLSEVVGDKHNYNLQKVDPTFNDTTGEYYNAFEALLQKPGEDLSSDDLCIDEYLARSEKAWFKKLRDAKLGRLSRDVSPYGSRRNSADGSRLSLGSHHSLGSQHSLSDDPEDNLSVSELDQDDEFLLGANYQRPTLVKRWLQTRIGDWPIYSLLLGLGQIMSVNSYQITLLTGGQGQTPEKVYIIGGIFMAATCAWWVVFRSLKSAYVLSLPWLFYGIAFILVGVAPFISKGGGRDWVRNVAVGMYTFASASGSMFFALNFGDEGMTTFPTFAEYYPDFS
jgi:alpha-1,3-glucan synthase